MVSKKDKETPMSTEEEKEIGKEYTDAYDAVSNVRDTWEEKEALLLNKNYDAISNSTKSQVNDGRLSTIVLERAARVVAQMPTGRSQALTKADAGKNVLMNLALEKYILPNAKAQFDQLTKLRMQDMYSQVYGMFPIMYDYSVTDNYVGPDSWLIPMRNFVPQKRKISINDSNYAFVLNESVTVDWLEGKAENDKHDIWNKKNIQYIIDQTKKGGKAKDTSKMSLAEQTREKSTQAEKGKYAPIDLVTKYEAGKKGKWITFAPDYQNRIVRSINNPHENGKIPVLLKYCFPLIDSIYGLGDFERGMTLQKAMNSLINLYLDGVKMSIFPPLMIDANGVVASTIKYSPAAKWLLTKPGAVNSFSVSPQGMNTFQNTYSFLISALLNQNGTTDTARDAGSDPGLGKTPQALQMQMMRESSRDNWDRFMMEKVIEDLYEAYINLLSNKQEKPINFHIFDAEIQQIKQIYPDVEGIEGSGIQVPAQELRGVVNFYDSGRAGKAVLSKKHIGNTEYKYYIDSSSTMKKDQAEENVKLLEIIQMVVKVPEIIQLMREKGKDIDLGEVLKRYIGTSGIQDPEKIVVDFTQQVVNGNLGQPGTVPGAAGTPPVAGNPPVANANPNAAIVDPDIAAFASKFMGGANAGQ